MAYDIPEHWDTSATEKAITLIWKERERYESMKQAGREGEWWGSGGLPWASVAQLIFLEEEMEEQREAQ